MERLLRGLLSHQFDKIRKKVDFSAFRFDDGKTSVDFVDNRTLDEAVKWLFFKKNKSRYAALILEDDLNGVIYNPVFHKSTNNNNPYHGHIEIEYPNPQKYLNHPMGTGIPTRAEVELVAKQELARICSGIWEKV